MNQRALPKIRARRLPSGEWICISGREAETLMELDRAGIVGLRAYDFPGGPPFRLAAYIHDLRRLGFPIRTDREKHQAGNHAVYFLECKIAVVVVGRQPPAAA